MFNDLKLLYLDDEPLVAFDTGDHLQTLGFDEVVVTYRLDQAREAARKTDFDIAILDINVDCGQTSVALGEELAAKGCKIIFASGFSEAAKDLRARGFGFLDKPFALAMLTERLEELVRDHLHAESEERIAATG